MVYISENALKRLGGNDMENEKYKSKVGCGETTIVNSFLNVDVSEMIMPGVIIYKHPDDMPKYKYVCRLREMAKDLPTNVVIARNSLEECRNDIMSAFPYMTVFSRDKTYLPNIVETWF